MSTAHPSSDGGSDTAIANGAVAPVVWGLVGVLVGAVIGLFGTLYTVHAQTSQQDKDRSAAANRELRMERRPIYKSVRDTANVYATAQADAFACQRTASGCEQLVDDVQLARYDFQRAINDMTIFGSSKAIAAMQRVASTLPPPLPATSNSEPTVGPVDEGGFDAALAAFDGQTRIDVAAISSPD